MAMGEERRGGPLIAVPGDIDKTFFEGEGKFGS